MQDDTATVVVGKPCLDRQLGTVFQSGYVLGTDFKALSLLEG